jgi:hypothetical protein
LVPAWIQTGFLYPTSLGKYWCHKREICVNFQKIKKRFYFWITSIIFNVPSVRPSWSVKCITKMNVRFFYMCFLLILSESSLSRFSTMLYKWVLLLIAFAGIQLVVFLSAFM